MLFVRTRIFGIREIWYVMVFVTNKIAERSYEDFLFVDFHENYIYSAEDYFYSYKDYFCSAEDFLGARKFSRRTKIFFQIFSRTFFEFGRKKFLFVLLHEYSVLFPEEKFYSCEDFLLVLTFFVRIFLGKIAQNICEFAVLFANIYKWSGTLVKFHEDFFSAQILCL